MPFRIMLTVMLCYIYLPRKGTVGSRVPSSTACRARCAAQCVMDAGYADDACISQCDSLYMEGEVELMCRNSTNEAQCSSNCFNMTQELHFVPKPVNLQLRAIRPEAHGAAFIQLSWEMTSRPETGYVYIVQYRHNETKKLWSTVTLVAETQFLFKPQHRCNIYSFRVFAAEPQGISEPSDSSLIKLFPEHSTPTNVAIAKMIFNVEKREISAELTWDPPAGLVGRDRLKYHVLAEMRNCSNPEVWPLVFHEDETFSYAKFTFPVHFLDYQCTMVIEVKTKLAECNDWSDSAHEAFKLDCHMHEIINYDCSPDDYEPVIDAEGPAEDDQLLLLHHTDMYPKDAFTNQEYITAANVNTTDISLEFGESTLFHDRHCFGNEIEYEIIKIDGPDDVTVEVTWPWAPVSLDEVEAKFYWIRAFVHPSAPPGREIENIERLLLHKRLKADVRSVLLRNLKPSTIYEVQICAYYEQFQGLPSWDSAPAEILRIEKPDDGVLCVDSIETETLYKSNYDVADKAEKPVVQITWSFKNLGRKLHPNDTHWIRWGKLKLASSQPPKSANPSIFVANETWELLTANAKVKKIQRRVNSLTLKNMDIDVYYGIQICSFHAHIFPLDMLWYSQTIHMVPVDKPDYAASVRVSKEENFVLFLVIGLLLALILVSMVCSLSFHLVGGEKDNAVRLGARHVRSSFARLPFLISSASKMRTSQTSSSETSCSYRSDSSLRPVISSKLAPGTSRSTISVPSNSNGKAVSSVTIKLDDNQSSSSSDNPAFFI